MSCLALQPGLCTGFGYPRQGDQCGAIRAFKDPFRWNPKPGEIDTPGPAETAPSLAGSGCDIGPAPRSVQSPSPAFGRLGSRRGFRLSF
jgi:hypothetical protein